MTLWREIRPSLMAVAPTVEAVLTLAAGLMLLASSATPTDPERFRFLAHLLPVVLIDASHFASSIIGLLLVLLAFGLTRRVIAAWGAAVALTLVAALLALLKGAQWEETTALLLLIATLVTTREAFDRKAALTSVQVTPGWLAAALAVAVGAGVLAVESFPKLADYDELWWRLLGDADSSRALRAVTGVALLALGFGVWRLFATPQTPDVITEEDPGFQRVRCILSRAEEADPDANVALLGDKRFLFSESGDSFLMFGVRGRSWIALSGPVGKASERAELLWRFREMADAHAARPALYGIGPELLPDVVDLGLSIQKIGEVGLVPLASFSLDGRRRGNLRRSWRKVGECGACFEVLPPGAADHVAGDLKRVSDLWLAEHTGGDKRFSMGGFDPRYVTEFPCAVVRLGGRVVAFATLWTTPDRSVFSIDLMRYAEPAPKDVMDYLFIELLLWGQAQGYGAFSLGMAPLAGLEDRRLAPLMSRVGRLVFERGEDLYNFQGVRRYKDKYDPVWEPRYIAAPSKWAIPLLMADVGLLSSGGVVTLRRAKREPARAPELKAAA